MKLRPFCCGVLLESSECIFLEAGVAFRQV